MCLVAIDFSWFSFITFIVVNYNEVNGHSFVKNPNTAKGYIADRYTISGGRGHQ